jgi:3',5'-cyclic AMP phosphodiesterase CpdA
MRFAQISDLHFTRNTWNPFRFCSKRVAGIVNWLLFRQKWFSHEPLAALPDLFKTLNVDLIFVCGDLTSTSLPSEFEMAKDFFNKMKLPKLFIPGNHDQYTHGSQRDRRFYRMFQNAPSPIQHPLQFFSLSEHGIEVHPLKPSWWCALLDTALPTSLASSNGLFSVTLEKHLEEVLRHLPKEDNIIILNHFPFFENDISLHRLIRGDRLRALIEQFPNVRLYLHGHTHRHTIADLRANHLPVILDSGCPVQKPHGTWNLIDCTDQGCTVKGYHWNGHKWVVFKDLSFDWSAK